MMSYGSARPLYSVIVAVVVLTTACDRMPADPADGGMDIAAALFGREAAELAGVPMSLPSLVQSALFKVYSEHGAQAARSMVMDLRRLQERARTAEGGERELAAAHARALEAEQLRIVLDVYGDDVVPYVMEAVREDADRLRERLTGLEGAGQPTDRASELFAQMAELLTDAEAAMGSGSRRAALAAGTRAAAVAHAVHDALTESQRIPVLEELFAVAVRRVGDARVPAALGGRLAELERSREVARDAVQRGDRLAAHDALAAARAQQVRVVLDVLGRDAVVRLLADAATARGELRHSLTDLAAARA
jgi:hypothetical protein